jgi:hypothetical protein
MALVGHSVWPCQAPHLASSGTLSGPVGHPVWHPIWPPSGTPFGPLSDTRPAPRPAPCRASVRHSVQPFVRPRHPRSPSPPDILIFSRRFCHPSPRPALPSGTMIWNCRFDKCSSCPPSDLPRPALPSGIPSGTLVSSRDLIGLQFLSCWIDARSGPRLSRYPTPI